MPVAVPMMKQDRAGQRGGVDQHRPQPLPVEAAVDQKPGEQRRRRCRWWKPRSRWRRPRPPRRGSRTAAPIAGSAITQRLQDLRRRWRLATRAEILAAVAPPHQRAQRDRQHHAGQQAAGEQRRDRDAGDRADGDQHDATAGWFRSARRWRRAGRPDRPAWRRAPSSPETAPAPPRPCRRPSSRRCRRPDTSRRSARRTGRRGRGRAGSPGTPTMARAMPVISISSAEEHEQRHRQQDQMAHALVHAADHHHQRRRAWSAPDSRRSPAPKQKAIGTPANTQTATTPTKKITRLMLPSGFKQRLRQPERGDHQHDGGDGAAPPPAPVCRRAPAAAARTAPSARCRPAAPRRARCWRCSQRRRGDEALLVGVFVGRPGDQAAGSASAAEVANASRNARSCGEAGSPPARSSACARRDATPTTAPSIASHRNRIEASSSDQISGLCRT